MLHLEIEIIRPGSPRSNKNVSSQSVAIFIKSIVERALDFPDLVWVVACESVLATERLMHVTGHGAVVEPLDVLEAHTVVAVGE
jgi:hypothetical protein